jgi:adenylate cyclase, class 2
MDKSQKELEVKFYLSHPAGFEARLRESGAVHDQPRTLERNLRFDSSCLDLTRSHQVLRLRQDRNSVLTYKGPGEEVQGVRLRREIEVEVSDFEATRDLLAALGFEVYVSYEKYRTSYRLDQVIVTLDELPYGFFTEIEGPDGPAIRAAAERLGLDWEARILDSYLAIFERLKPQIRLEARDLSFENFRGAACSPEMMGVKPGDD